MWAFCISINMWIIIRHPFVWTTTNQKSKLQAGFIEAGYGTEHYDDIKIHLALIDWTINRETHQTSNKEEERTAKHTALPAPTEQRTDESGEKALQ